LSAVFGERPYEFTSSAPAFVESKSYQGSLKAEFSTSPGTLSSVTAYSDTEALYTQDGDFSNLDLLFYRLWQDQNDLSQELIFSSDQIGSFRLVGGAFYYHSDGRYDPLEVSGAGAGPVAINVVSRQVTEAYAVFGEVNYDINDRLTLIGGARFSDESKRAYGAFRFGPGPYPESPRLASKSWSSFTPRVTLQYELLEDDHLYLTYSQGFKSGGFNIAAADPVPFDQEKLRALELGVKTSPSRILSANIAAFYYDYKDQQVQTLVNNFNVTANAASSEIYGLDADVTVRITDSFTLIPGVSLLHAKFDEYPNAVVLKPIVVTPGVICNCGNAPTVADLSGYSVPKSPAWTLGLTANYQHQFEFGEVELNGMLFHSDEFYWDASQRVREPSYTTVSARASWRPVDSSFRISVWGKNLTDATYTKTSFILETGDGVVFERPRTYGVGVEYTF
jgi:iron complex outermembrane receptor protein